MPNSTGRKVLTRLTKVFYEVIPPQYKTYCALTSRIAYSVLRRFGHEASVAPCQLSLAIPNQVFLFGFIDPAPQAQWNGHAICTSDGYLFDAALAHCQKFVASIPDSLATPLAPPFATAIARTTLDQAANVALWWLPPPSGFDTALPDEPESLIEQFADRLFKRLLIL
jgi:hypothetical protein